MRMLAQKGPGTHARTHQEVYDLGSNCSINEKLILKLHEHAKANTILVFGPRFSTVAGKHLPIRHCHMPHSLKSGAAFPFSNLEGGIKSNKQIQQLGISMYTKCF